MRIIRPITIDASNLAASNVPEVAPAAWSSGTTYALAATASIVAGTTRTVYESLAAGNLNHAPATSPTWWLDRGPTNRHRMFDQSNSSQTTNGGAIVAAVQVSGRADALALLNITAATVRVLIETVADGVIFDQTINLVSNAGITDWYAYFFEPITRKADVVFYDLPLNADPKFTVTLTDPDATAACGAMILGQSRGIGTVIHPLRVGIQDYSRKVTDDFGNFTIVERAYAKRSTFKIVVEEDLIDEVVSLLAAYRATAVVWVGVDAYASTWIYGWARDWSVELANPRESYLNLELEGLT